MHMLHIRLVLVTSLLSLPACGGDDTCNPVANDGCDDGLSCEVVEGGDPGCFAPVWVRGRVFDLETADAIEGASYEFQSALTDIGLLPYAGAGNGQISGNVEITEAQTGVLVVAEGPITGSTHADRAGTSGHFYPDAGGA